MAIDTDKLKRETDIVQVVGHYTNLTKRGHEFIGQCVAHNDSNASMTVSPSKGFVHCFACGFHADVIDFIREVEGLDFKAAAEFLGSENDWKPNLSIPNAKPLEKLDRITRQPPLGSRPESLAIRIKNDEGEYISHEPVKSWDYNNERGELLGIATRYEVNGSKEIRMWTYAARGEDEAAWGCGHFNFPRPLFNLDKIANNDLPVLIVEGEKCAEAAGILLPQYVATTWTGGANSFNKTSLTPLAGKKVVLMPDNDDAGRECMNRLAETLSDPSGLNCTVKILDTSDMDEKWDIADALAMGWTSEQFIAWAKKRSAPYAHKSQTYEKKTAQEPERPSQAQPDEQPETHAAPTTKPKLTVVNRPARTIAVGSSLQRVEPSQELVAVEAHAMSPSFLAHKFVEFYGENWRFISQWNRWLFWNGDTWKQDFKFKYFQQGWELADSAKYWDEARNCNDSQLKSLSFRAYIGGFLELARSHEKIASSPDEWDADNMLLGIPSGVIDLRTGKSIEGAREQLISRQVAVRPDKGDCPLWLSTIARATGNSQEMHDYLQRMAGYILTGETKEECFFFVYGPGASGKSTFCRTLTEILKDYSQAASMDAFMAKQNQEHATEIARMAGARLVVATETDEGARWNESRIKALTGRDKISARFMRGDLFDFQPTAKILIAGNHKPQLRSVGEEMKRRIHLIDFPDSIPEAERDRDLSEKLKAEYPQILNWMIEGAIKWNKQGLKRPESIVQATNEYLSDEDSYTTWLDECCVIGTGEKVAVSIAFHSYQAWCKDNNEYVPSQKRFLQRFVDRGYPRIRGGGNYLGGFSMKESNLDNRGYYND
jgi:putative DNA primase/helicase